MIGTDFSLTTLACKRKTTSPSAPPAFSPTSLSGLAAWYDPSDLSTLFQDSAMTVPVVSDGNPVGAILDKSGNGRHMLQSVNDSRPTYRAAAGVSWIEADGVDDYMSATPPVSGFDFTMIVGAGGIAANRGIITLHASSSRYWSLDTTAVGAQTSYRVTIRDGATYLVSQNGPTAASVVLGEWTADQVSLSVDGAADATTLSTGSASGVVDLRLFSFRAGSFTSGNIYGALVYDGTLSASERTAVTSWIAAKQGRDL